MLDRSASWVLVGNGPSATSRRLGSIIDAHDCIVRFNHYETAGFEEMLGSRCTHWATHGCPVKFGAEAKVITPSPEAAQPRYAMLVHQQAPCPRGVEVEASYNAPQEVMSDMRARIGKLPSTGIATIYWLLKIIGVKKLHLVGFDSFQKDRSKRHHYWDPTIYKMPTEHDPDKEKAIIIHWAQVGRVAMLT